MIRDDAVFVFIALSVIAFLTAALVVTFNGAHP